MNNNDTQLRIQRIESLQKLPKAQCPEISALEFLVDILYGEPWTKEQFDAIPKPERQKFAHLFTIGINYLGDEDRDHFLQQIAPIITPETRRQLWEHNHRSILCAINKLTLSYGRFPSRREIAEETGLSRLTVNKHLKEYFGSPEQQERQEDFVLMREKVLAKVYEFAIEGDTKAAKLFLEATSNQQPATHIRNQQNNFLQINGLTITQDQLQSLPEEKQSLFLELIQTLTKQ